MRMLLDWNYFSKVVCFVTNFFFWKLPMLCLIGNSELIDRATQRGTILPNKTWETHTYNGPAATISYRIRVVCDKNYYGKSCTKFCLPRNDTFGHFTCDENGNKVCMAGWRGKHCETGRWRIDIFCSQKQCIWLRQCPWLSSVLPFHSSSTRKPTKNAQKTWLERSALICLVLAMALITESSLYLRENWCSVQHLDK